MMPRVLAPLHSPPSPALFRNFKAGIEKSFSQIKTFRNNYQAPETQTVLRYARERAAADSDLSKSIDVPQYGWTEREKRSKEALKKNTETAVELQAALSDEDVARIVQEWKERHPDFTIKENGLHDLSVRALQDP